MIYDDVTQLIGDTPLLRIAPAVHGIADTDIYAKLEYFNPFGSVKDRVAWAMLRDELPSILERGQTVLESSSGNTGKALQAICSMHGVPFKLITNRVKVEEVREVLQVLGAQIEEMRGQSECPDPSDPENPFTVIERLMAGSPGAYLHTSQYTNDRNRQAHYDTTGEELLHDLGRVDVLAGGLGTAGSTRGAAERLRAASPDLTLVGIIAKAGQSIPGIRTEAELLEVGLFQRSLYDAVVPVSDDDAVDGMLTLARRCGVLGGPTSGAAFAGLLTHLRKHPIAGGTRRTAVFIVCDRLEWYLSYIRKRRPELFGRSRRGTSIADVPDDALRAVPSPEPAEARAWIGEERPLVIDLRSNGAYRSARIPGSISIPQAVFADMTEGGQAFPSGMRLLLVCPVGDQSARAAAYLRTSGMDARSLAGGITAWRDAGLPLERPAP